MKRFLIHVSTNWCGMDYTYRAIADNPEDLYDLAEQLAYENFESYDLWVDVAQSEGYDPDEMTEEDWDNLYDTVNEANYYNFDIEEFTGDENEWNDWGGEVYE